MKRNRSSLNSSLKDIDPVLYAMIDFFSSVISTYLGNRWNVEVAACGRSDLSGKIVAQAIPYDCFPLRKETEFNLPLLSVYRQEEAYDWKTYSWYTSKSYFGLTYLMPPLDVEQTERLVPFLKGIKDVIINRTLNGMDTSYNGQERVWFDAGIQEIGIVNAQFGKVGNTDSNMYFPALTMRFEVIERNMPAPNLLEGMDGFDGYVSENGVELDDVKVDF